jgi:Domain of unknown function (DUF4169)
MDPTPYPVTTTMILSAIECRMGPVINLRTERKRAKKQVAEQAAAERRALFGRSKAQANLERARNDKAQTCLDQRRIETGDLE